VSTLEVTAALLVALVWGVQFVTSKYEVDVLPPLLFVTLRFATVGLLLPPFAGRPTRRRRAHANRREGQKINLTTKRFMQGRSV